ncbi:MAG: hypothetical protein LBC97_06030 [Bifidobacteriaceae bacterium]|nr:hypothetical protein [Bifidobacteriaceae bacterium]
MASGVNALVDQLEAAGVAFVPGLSLVELRDAEELFGFVFPPDLAELLRARLPDRLTRQDRNGSFVNWRRCLHSREAEKEARTRLGAPLEGVLFDIEANSFWLPDWGEKPDTRSERERVCRERLRGAPTLIPVFSHRFIPATPSEAGNPVFSVHQTDIILYGNSLADYFHHEFGGASSAGAAPGAKRIEFWSELVDLNG